MIKNKKKHNSYICMDKNQTVANIKVILAVMTLVAVMLIQPLMAEKVYAASGTISVSSVSGQVGEQVSIDIAVKSDTEISVLQLYVKYDSSVAKIVSGHDGGGSGTVQIVDTNMDSDSKTYTLVFEILSVGKSAISISTDISYGAAPDGDTRIEFAASSGSVTGEPAPTYSSDNDLASLEISQGVLSPAFSSGKTEYTTAVSHDVSVLTVSAIASDDNATVNVDGTHLDYGNNTVTITVTAENGSVKKYYIYVTREEAPEQPSETESSNETDETESATEKEKSHAVKIDDSEYVINDDYTANPLPDGFSEEEYIYNNVKIKVGRGVNSRLIIMYLDGVTDKTDSGFYVYDSVSEEFYEYVALSLPAREYVALPITKGMEVPSGYEKSEYEINGHKIQILKKANAEYCLFYGVDSDGKQGWYTYDYSSKTIQKFYNYADTEKVVMDDDEQDNNRAGNDNIWKLISLASMLFAVICLVIAIVCAIRSINKKTVSSDEDLDDITDENDNADGDEELEEDILEASDILEEVEADVLEAADIPEASDEEIEEVDILEIEEVDEQDISEILNKDGHEELEVTELELTELDETKKQ